jgi:hypothetical protein
MGTSQRARQNRTSPTPVQTQILGEVSRFVTLDVEHKANGIATTPGRTDVKASHHRSVLVISLPNVYGRKIL